MRGALAGTTLEKGLPVLRVGAATIRVLHQLELHGLCRQVRSARKVYPLLYSGGRFMSSQNDDISSNVLRQMKAGGFD
ncbi:hypothetical protein AB9U01_32065, partial [Pseudomonas qingdaonensis]